MGRVSIRLCLQVSLLPALSGVASAAEVAEKSVVLPESAYAIQILGYVVAILILLGAGVLVLFKGGFVGGLRPGGRVVKKLQIEETKMLGHRQYLIVAEYEGRRMMLGVCPGRIDYLCPLDSEIGDDVGNVKFPDISSGGQI